MSTYSGRIFSLPSALSELYSLSTTSGSASIATTWSLWDAAMRLNLPSLQPMSVTSLLGCDATASRTKRSFSSRLSSM